MKAYVEDVMYLDGKKGEFTNNQGETIEYQNAEFFQYGEDSGGSMTFAVIKDCPIEEFKRMGRYDLELDIRQVSNNSNGGKSFRCRVVGYGERS